MKKIKIKDIKIGKRVREDFGDINYLVDNIKENGLIVPIVIDKNKRLVDGERRIKAYNLLKKKESRIICKKRKKRMDSLWR